MDKNSKLLTKINFTESYTNDMVLKFLREPTYWCAAAEEGEMEVGAHLWILKVQGPLGKLKFSIPSGAQMKKCWIPNLHNFSRSTTFVYANFHLKPTIWTILNFLICTKGLWFSISFWVVFGWKLQLSTCHLKYLLWAKLIFVYIFELDFE